MYNSGEWDKNAICATCANFAGVQRMGAAEKCIKNYFRCITYLFSWLNTPICCPCWTDKNCRRSFSNSRTTMEPP
jgi:hypothetical protein